MSTCKGCGREIFFAKNEANKTVPLERVRAFELDWDTEHEVGRAMKIERDVYISHFQTCPQAKNFSRQPTLKQTGFEGL